MKKKITLKLTKDVSFTATPPTLRQYREIKSIPAPRDLNDQRSFALYHWAAFRVVDDKLPEAPPDDLDWTMFEKAIDALSGMTQPKTATDANGNEKVVIPPTLDYNGTPFVLKINYGLVVQADNIRRYGEPDPDTTVPTIFEDVPIKTIREGKVPAHLTDSEVDVTGMTDEDLRGLTHIRYSIPDRKVKESPFWMPTIDCKIAAAIIEACAGVKVQDIEELSIQLARTVVIGFFTKSTETTTKFYG